jgi:hypothetical protein
MNEEVVKPVAAGTVGPILSAGLRSALDDALGRIVVPAPDRGLLFAGILGFRRSLSGRIPSVERGRAPKTFASRLEKAN